QTLRVWNLQPTTTAEFNGVGCYFRCGDGHPVIERITPLGPAARDGRLRPGDRLVAVAEQGREFTSLAGKSHTEASSLVHGKDQSVVRLEVLPAGMSEPVVYELKRGRFSEPGFRTIPLLSLYSAGDDWIAWTPEGYYAASPGGEKLIGWQVNNGRDQMAS